MKYTFAILILFMIVPQLFGQDYCIPHRFVHNYYFRSRDIMVDRDIEYGQASNYKGLSETLDLDLYYPSANVDTFKKRPLILLMHGGGKENKSQMEKYCPLFAQRGFVIANINRRMGRKNDSEFELYKEAYRYLQDAHAALRFLTFKADVYGIDTSAIFVGGSSAGALTSTGIAYLSNTDFETQYPLIYKALGRIDNSTNQIKAKFSIRGVIDMWGQVADTAFISNDEAQSIPIIMFHGTVDQSMSPYVKSRQIADRYKNLGGCYQLHTKTGAGHGQDMSKYYICAMTGCFIKKVLCNSCVSLETEIDNNDISCFKTLPFDRSPFNRQSIKANTSMYNRFIGTYKTKSKNKLEITCENGQLYLQDKAKDFKAELHPESETDFFIKEDNIQVGFHEKGNSKITGLTIFIDAKKIWAKKKI